MNTAFGVLCDRDGLAAKETLERGADRPELRLRAWSTPAADVLPVQEAVIPVDWNHNGRECGQVVYLERSANGDLWCIAHVDDSVEPVVHVAVGDDVVAVEHDLFWSATRVGDESHGLLVTSVAVTPHPARVNAKPITILRGELDHKLAADRWQLRRFDRELLTRAAVSHVERRRSRGPIVVHDQALAASRERLFQRGRLSAREQAIALIEDEELQPAGPLRYSAPVRNAVIRVR